MENLENKLTLNPLPLEINVNEKLKVFAIVSVNKIFASQYIKPNDKNIFLTMAGSYFPLDAIEAAKSGLKLLGVDPDFYNIGQIAISRNIDEIVQFPTSSPVVAPLPLPIDPTEKLVKSKTQLASYVNYVFDKSGTEEEKKVAGEVINKFLQLNE